MIFPDHPDVCWGAYGSLGRLLHLLILNINSSGPTALQGIGTCGPVAVWRAFP